MGMPAGQFYVIIMIMGSDDRHDSCILSTLRGGAQPADMVCRYRPDRVYHQPVRHRNPRADSQHGDNRHCMYLHSIRGHNPASPLLYVSAATAVLSIAFLFSVGAAFDHLQPHQKLRIQVALGIVEDLRSAGYNVNQSKIAIGSGGFFGKGFPQRHSDKTQIRARAAHRLHILHYRRGRRLRGYDDCDPAIPRPILRVIAIGERQPTTLRSRLCLLRGLVLHIPFLYQHRHGHRPVPRYRHSPTLLQLRRLIAVGIHDTAVHTPQARRLPQQLPVVLTPFPRHFRFRKGLDADAVSKKSSETTLSWLTPRCLLRGVFYPP